MAEKWAVLVVARTALPGLPRGDEEELPADGGSRRNIVLRCSILLNVGHELHIDSTVLRPPFSSALGRYFLIFAQPCHVDLVHSEVVLRSKVLRDGCGTLFAKLILVLHAANRVSSTD